MPHAALTGDFATCKATPNQLRWAPFEYAPSARTFVDSLFTVCGAGSAASKSGYAIHMYAATASMGRTAFANADGDLLIVPQEGALLARTECGVLEVSPGEILVVQRGMRFRLDLPEGRARGYVLEVFAGHFQLPDLGPIGANGLANPRDFLSPVASYEEEDGVEHRVVHKFEGELFEARQDFSPFNVVAWHGNYVPYKYDLSKFCPVNAVAFDHPDPSIFTVLTCPSDRPGTAVADFVIFPPRHVVAEHTFRPPYFHRNVMSEFMGLIRGEYDAKSGGFVPGGASLHMCMTPHGPDAQSYANAIKPEAEKLGHLPRNTLAFMFETYFTPRLTSHALELKTLEQDYYKVWEGLQNNFDANWTCPRAKPNSN